MKLILIRHAKSSWSDPAMSDHARPLNARGRRDAPRIGAWLLANGYLPTRILCSDAARTRETLALMQPHLEDADLHFLPALYHASPDQIRACARPHTNTDGLAIIGHNPGLAALAASLPASAPTHPRFDDFPTCATAVFNLHDKALSPGSAQLTAFVTPHDL